MNDLKLSQSSLRKIDNIRASQFTRESGFKYDDYWRMPKVSIIIGLGGIGSHVCDILASSRDTKALIFFDDDTVEMSNLNRSAYSYRHIGEQKVNAMAEIVTQRNLSIDIYPINEIFCEKSIDKIRELKKVLDRFGCTHIFDCRDNDYQDYGYLKDSILSQYRVWRLAYNGMSITLDASPEKHPVHGSPGYSDIPSHSIPSRLIALLGIIYASTFSKYSNDFLEKSFTLDSSHIIDGISLFCELMRLKNFDLKKYHHILDSLKPTN